MNLDAILNPKKEGLVLTAVKKAKLKKDNQTCYFNSGDFNFLNDHKSLRPGKKHLLLGTAGSGK